MRDNNPPNQIPTYDRVMPVLEAARLLGLPAWKLRRAAKAGLFPSYQLGNSRRLIRPAEVLTFIFSTRQGGDR